MGWPAECVGCCSWQLKETFKSHLHVTGGIRQGLKCFSHVSVAGTVLGLLDEPGKGTKLVERLTGTSWGAMRARDAHNIQGAPFLGGRRADG